MENNNNVSIRYYQPGDEENIIELLKNTFPKWANFDNPLELWRWKYIDTPLRTMIRLVVADQGIGMSEQEITSIFTPFTQGNMELSRPYAGIGLGLAIVQSLTELHAGRVDVESQPGQGSTFTVHFPVIEPAIAREAADN